jgi:hypothetical protein
MTVYEYLTNLSETAPKTNLIGSLTLESPAGCFFPSEWIENFNDEKDAEYLLGRECVYLPTDVAETTGELRDANGVLIFQNIGVN